MVTLYYLHDRFQVTEVLSRDKTRLSISGWFHGETAAFPRKIDPLPLLKEPPIEDGVTEDEGCFFKRPRLPDGEN